MNALFIGMRKLSKELATYLLFATGVFCLLFYVGNFGGGFLPVMGNLFLMILEIALWIVIPVLLTVGKNDLAKKALRPIFSFWLIHTVYTFLTDCTQGGGWALADALCVFELLIACAFIVMAVFTVLSYVRKDMRLKKIAFLIFVGCLVFYLVVFSLRVVVYAQMGVGWNAYFEAIYNYLSLPFGMFFLAQHFEFTLDDMNIFKAPAAPKSDETPAEEEAAVLEETSVEEPAAETPDEAATAETAEDPSEEDNK